MANRWGNSGNSDRFILGGSKITADDDCSHEIKRRLLLGRKVMTNLCYAMLCWVTSVVSDSVWPLDCSPPGFPIPGTLQARTLEWIAISFSNAWKWKEKVKSLSRVWLLATPWTAGYQAPPSMGFSRQEYWSGLPLPSPSLFARIFNSFGVCWSGVGREIFMKK